MNAQNSQIQCERSEDIACTYTMLIGYHRSSREINGGSCLAMLGDKCVAIACDLRLGNQALTINCDFEKVLIILSYSGA